MKTVFVALKAPGGVKHTMTYVLSTESPDDAVQHVMDNCRKDTGSELLAWEIEDIFCVDQVVINLNVDV